MRRTRRRKTERNSIVMRKTKQRKTQDQKEYRKRKAERGRSLAVILMRMKLTSTAPTAVFI
jgi:hypothetical protein